jgi:hypothetical protein
MSGGFLLDGERGPDWPARLVLAPPPLSARRHPRSRTCTQLRVGRCREAGEDGSSVKNADLEGSRPRARWGSISREQVVETALKVVRGQLLSR